MAVDAESAPPEAFLVKAGRQRRPAPGFKYLGALRTLMRIEDLQDLMERTYGERDRARGARGCALWLCEEVGETAQALRRGDRTGLGEEMADVLAWLASLANVSGVNLERELLAKYGKGCPRCGSVPCRCPNTDSPAS